MFTISITSQVPISICKYTVLKAQCWVPTPGTKHSKLLLQFMYIVKEKTEKPQEGGGEQGGGRERGEGRGIEGGREESYKMDTRPQGTSYIRARKFGYGIACIVCML